VTYLLRRHATGTSVAIDRIFSRYAFYAVLFCTLSSKSNHLLRSKRISEVVLINYMHMLRTRWTELSPNTDGVMAQILTTPQPVQPRQITDDGLE